ncbi:helix-turn-helix transcriptional regulator, partial [Enterococcus hirae]
YLSIFFIKLLRDFDYETNGQTSRKEQEILEILKYLETNYESLDLSLLAKKFNYTPNYLSTLLKKKIGKSYSEIILEKKLDRAHALLQHSDLTINDVAIAAGFTNPTFFYNKYKEKFNKLPSER